MQRDRRQRPQAVPLRLGLQARVVWMLGAWRHRMTPDALAVVVEDAIKALSTRAKLAGVSDPDHFAREFVLAIRHQGWRPFAPVTVLPHDGMRPADAHRAAVLASEAREQIRLARAVRPQHLEDTEETP